MHSNSWKDPFYQKIYLQLNERTKGASAKFCAVCHSPIGVLSGEIPPADGSKVSRVAGQGVTCDFCHTVSEARGIGNFSALSSPGAVKYGQIADPVVPSHAYHKNKFSALHASGEFCGMCHSVTHPVTKVAIESTYYEWKRGPYAKAGITCQDCHMTPGPGVEKPNLGKAAVDGPRREHVYTHEFVGGNVGITELLGSLRHSNLAVERLKAAATLEILLPSSAEPGRDAEIGVKVTNVGAGHSLPTGATEFREMWLDVSVTDSSGREIFRSGAINEKGDIDPEAVVYNTIMGDKDGKPTEDIWKAAKILKDKRIPPKESATERYVVRVPADAVFPLRVKAYLKYRSARQSLVDELFGRGTVVLPIINMAQSVADIK